MYYLVCVDYPACVQTVWVQAGQLSLEDAQALGWAVVGVWAVAWTFVVLKRVIR